MPEGPVIANNTPLVSLWVLNKLYLLRDLYNQVLIPLAVHEEFLAVNTASRQQALRNAPWIIPTSIQHPERSYTNAPLDNGEAAVLALAKETDTRLVIMDERLGREHARRMGLRITGTLGVLLLAKEAGQISTVTPLIDQLLDNGLYLGERLIRRALELAGESIPDGDAEPDF